MSKVLSRNVRYFQQNLCKALWLLYEPCATLLTNLVLCNRVCLCFRIILSLNNIIAFPIGFYETDCLLCEVETEVLCVYSSTVSEWQKLTGFGRLVAGFSP